MVRLFLKRFGLVRTTLMVTLLSIIVSVIFMLAITWLAGESPSTLSWVMSIVIPAIVASLFGYLTLRLVFQLQAAEEKLRALSTIDELTQAYNRRFFLQLAEREWSRASRYGDEFAIVLFDIDGFKEINDTYGHFAGDRVLKTVSAVCRAAIRESDTFARFGGDEFVFLIPQSDQVDIVAFMERICRRLADTVMSVGDRDINISVSMGARRYDRQLVSFDALLIEADQAMYAAKDQGRGRVVERVRSLETESRGDDVA